jgi:predicted nucleic acid-binding protein
MLSERLHILISADQRRRLQAEAQRRHEAPQLGRNDRLHVGACLTQGIEVIVSANAGFDRVRGTRRVDPLDDRARRRLLRSARG